jgi:DNA-binding transcriptional MocR family regulator
LPTHRALAAELGLDVTTVTRAYAEARRLELVDARTGRGTFVAATALPMRRAGVTPAIDLSMNLPPQPEGAALDAKLAATLAEIRRQPGFAPYLTYQQAGGSVAERAVAADWLRLRLPALTSDRVLVAPEQSGGLMLEFMPQT